MESATLGRLDAADRRVVRRGAARNRKEESIMVRVRPLVLVLAVLLPLLAGPTGHAQEATPAAGAWVGSEPDLAAMLITPGDLEAMGLPGMGRFFNGWFNSLDGFAEGTAGFYGHSVEETRAMAERIGLSRAFGSAMGLPSVPGEESPPARGAYANIFELRNPSETDAFFDYVVSAAPGPDAQFSVVEAPFTLGERALVANYTSRDPETGGSHHEFIVIFQSGNLLVDAGFFADVPEEGATPEASPAAGHAALSSPAATVAELETLGRRQLARMETVLASGSPNLPALLLRLGDDPLAATADYSEGYRLLDGELPPYYAGRDDDIIADPATYTGAVAAYELEERFQRGEEEAPGDYYFLTRLFAFPDEAAAASFMASRPDALATGGFAKVSDAAPDARQELLTDAATDLGDESLAFSFVRAFEGDENQYTGYEVFVRVGSTVAAVSLEGPPDMPLEQVAEIAAAQAACLQAGACPYALAVPEAFLAGPEATPAA